MKIYKLELEIIDFDEVGLEIPEILENTKYPNHCINPSVKSMMVADVGNWCDEHPLNQPDKVKQEQFRANLKWSACSY